MISRCLSLVLVASLYLLGSVAAESTPVFTSGQDGYHTYRIPSVIATKQGTLLAFCEARKSGRGDAGDIDLVSKRSIDGGKTWGPMQIVWDDAGNTCGNPCPVIDRDSGTIWLPLTHNLGRDSEQQIVANTGKASRTAWIMHSTDDGVTWSKPVEITNDVKKPEWTWYATGPGVGIQLKSGRLLIPCDSKGLHEKTRESHVIYSDDHGKTWKLGGVTGPECNESQAVELSDGTVMLNMRTYRKNKVRLVSLSKDGGETFSAPQEDTTLIEPVCQGSILRHETAKGFDRPPILFSNPAAAKRENMTVRMSLDDGKTWPRSLVLHKGPAAYSCLTVLSDGVIGCLFECGEKHAYEEIRFDRLTMDALK